RLAALPRRARPGGRAGRDALSVLPSHRQARCPAARAPPRTRCPTRLNPPALPTGSPSPLRGVLLVFLPALLLFLLIALATWAVAIALYQTYVGGPGLRQAPDFLGASALAVGLVTLASFLPFPVGYVVSLGAWWLAARHLLGPAWPR